ncbi:MAG TPA: metal-dependent transcriptional regulator [Anaerolineales bacterium]|nr:metal-dependent transcriptional regulator [Anaerolineales bacterium]
MIKETDLSQASEDYLRTIYALGGAETRVSTTQIAEALQVRPASVTGMIQKMAEMQTPLVDYRKHQGVILSRAGKQAALRVVRHHRLLELFLEQILGYEWDQVHAEADRLEHVVSPELERRMFEILGEPLHDPHGAPIPTDELKIPPPPQTRLSDLESGEAALILAVPDEDPALLRYLAEIGLRPRALVLVRERSPFDGNLRLRIDDALDAVVLGPAVTQQVKVQRLIDSPPVS